MNNINVSVVIATLGGACLNKTIESLNNSSIIPKEILICIPKDYAMNVMNIKFFNVKIIITETKGQVTQRMEGFQKVKHPFVLQLDDDIVLDSFCLEKLLEMVILKNNIAVGPKIFDQLTNKYHGFLIPTFNSLKRFDKIFYYIANGKRGYQPGEISKSGLNFGIPENPGTIYNVDWLCGGCIMHRKENLVLTNFYPLSGKAYSEDLFHSKLLRDNNVMLVRSGESKCYVNFSSSTGGTVYNSATTFIRAFQAIKMFVKSNNGNIFRLHIAYFFFLIRLFLVKIMIGSYYKINGKL